MRKRDKKTETELFSTNLHDKYSIQKREEKTGVFNASICRTKVRNQDQENSVFARLYETLVFAKKNRKLIDFFF